MADTVHHALLLPDANTNLHKVTGWSGDTAGQG